MLSYSTKDFIKNCNNIKEFRHIKNKFYSIISPSYNDDFNCEILLRFQKNIAKQIKLGNKERYTMTY